MQLIESAVKKQLQTEKDSDIDKSGAER
jgi:hypothetical protein